MTRPLFRPSIVLTVSFVLLIVILIVIGNMFEIQVRPKSTESKNDAEETSTQNIPKKTPLPAQAPTQDAAIGIQSFPKFPALPENARPQIQPTPPQFFAIYENLMTDIGIPNHLKEMAVDVLKSFDAEIKQQMEAALRGETPPSPEVFKAMEARRDQKLRDILGDSQYQVYSENVDTMPERAAISSVQSRLEGAGMALSKDQSDMLFQAMVDGARSQNPAAEYGADLETKGPFGAMNNRFRKASGALREASSVLSEAQKAEIDRFIEDTNRKRARMRR